MGNIVNFSDIKSGTNATIITSAGMYSGTILGRVDDMIEVENAVFFPYVNLEQAFELRHLFLRTSEVIGFADPIGQCTRSRS